MNDPRPWLVESPPEAASTTPESWQEPVSDFEADPAIARLVTALAAVDDRFKHIGIVYPRLVPTTAVVATSLLAATMAGAQLAADQGPVWEAMHTGLPVVVTTADREPRPSRIHVVARILGVHVHLALPLTDGTRAVGALSLYLTDGSGVHPAVRELAEAVALQASAALAEEQRIGKLEAAMQTRQDVAKACGILMSRFVLSDGQALAALRQVAQIRNVTVADLAREVMATGTLPELEGNR